MYMGPPYFTERTGPDRTQTLIHGTDRIGMALNARANTAKQQAS